MKEGIINKSRNEKCLCNFGRTDWQQYITFKLAKILINSYRWMKKKKLSVSFIKTMQTRMRKKKLMFQFELYE